MALPSDFSTNAVLIEKENLGQSPETWENAVHPNIWEHDLPGGAITAAL